MKDFPSVEEVKIALQVSFIGLLFYLKKGKHEGICVYKIFFKRQNVFKMPLSVIAIKYSITKLPKLLSSNFQKDGDNVIMKTLLSI